MAATGTLNYQKTILPNGLTIISESIPHVRSVSVGVWICTGTRFESREKNGVAHFLEHMLFKGTERRSARQIVRDVESLGGNINAFTSKEQTCFHIEIIDEYLPNALDVLADILCRPRLSETAFAKEKRVILDEIQSVEDTPDEWIQDYFVEQIFPAHGLGLPILGTRESVSRLKPADIRAFYRAHYQPGNVIVAVSGNVDHARLVDLVDTFFEFPGENLPGSPAYQKLIPPPKFVPGDFFVEKPVNQAHVCMGGQAPGYVHSQKYDLLVLNNLLGGGMGSRLFQNIRERHGIAYGIYSFLDFYYDSGLLGVYLGTDIKNLEKVVQLVRRELVRLGSKRVSERELQDAKSHLKGSLVLGMESTIARMNHLAVTELYLQKFVEIDEMIAKINRVTRDSVLATAANLLDTEQMFTVCLIPLKSD